MTKILVVLALAASLSACSKKDDGGGGGAAGGGGGGGNVAGGAGDCATSIDKALDAMTSGQSMQGIDAVKGQLRGVYVKHCETNKWPADVLACFAGASGMPSIKACREKLPPEQAQAISAEIRQIMMGAAGGGGGPMHGGGAAPHGGGAPQGTPPMGGTEGPPKSE